jgi:hypothetical protein
MRCRSLLVLAVALLAPATAQAAHFDAPPPTYNTTGVPITFPLAADGHSVSSGVAYKLSTETAWHRCLAPGPVTITPPAGDYTLQIADDTNRGWFDANLPQAQTPECGGAGAPLGRGVTVGYFYVRNAPPPEPRVTQAADACGLQLGRVATLHRKAETAQARYERRRTKARRRGWRAAVAAYSKARRAYDKRC